MPLQDLTPQLRTRLNRMERAVGWFIILATVLLILGFGYYVYNTAESRGWFKVKAPYFTYAQNGKGILVGDPIKLMGFPAGRITQIQPMPPKWGENSSNNVYIEFEVLEPNFGYLWTEGSVAQFTESGFLGKRELDLTKGTGGYATYIQYLFEEKLTVGQAEALPHLEKWRLGEEIYAGTNLVIKAWQPLSTNLLEKIASLGRGSDIRAIDTDPASKKNSLTAVWNEENHYYERFVKTNSYGLPRDEPPPLTDRLQAMVAQVQAALPNVLQLTNQLSTVLSNSTRLTSNLNAVAESARPVFTNLLVITTNLREPEGSLGEWLIPTNLHQQLETTLQTADGSLTNVNTNLVALASNLNLTLANLAGITSNLNNQVQVNSNILSRISDAVVHSDQFVQGLKRFWLFRRLFRGKTTNAPPARVDKSPPSPKAATEREKPLASSETAR